MTSNLGSELLLKKPNLDKEELLTLIEPVIKATFRPEFINRLDDIIPFLPLKEKDMEKIVVLQLKRVALRLLDRNIHLSWSPKILKHLAEKGYDPDFGARPLKRLIQNQVVNFLANELIMGKIPNNSEVYLTGHEEKDEFILSFEIKEAKQHSIIL
jgi:ATP-dependent Clp protease ATP-binding subunit ClpB